MKSREILWSFLILVADLIVLYIPISPSFPVQSIIGIILVSVLPGYWLCALLSPKKLGLMPAERLGIILLGSVLSAIGVPYFVSSLGLPLTTRSVSFTMDSLVLILIISSLLRTHFFPDPKEKQESIFRTLSFWLPTCLAVVVAGGTFATVKVAMKPSVSFFVTGPNDQLSGYPFQIHQGARFPVALHVTNPTNSSISGIIRISDSSGVLGRRVIAVRGGHAISFIYLLPSSLPAGEETVSFVLIAGNTSRTLQLKYDISS